MLPRAPSLVAGHGRAALLTEDGELLTLPAAEMLARLKKLRPPLLVHAPATFRRLGMKGGAPALDLLELFAFVLPARPVAPTPRGLALALDLKPPTTLEEAAAILPDIAATLLHRMHAAGAVPLNAQAAGIADRMGRAGWHWAPAIRAALPPPTLSPDAAPGLEGFKPWRRLPEWEEA
ncbi:MAG TPA: ATP-dependent DNA helicase, partial [Acetobacteraceae bacterium]|nr:ATP-dependent DNA helicase [Acetobacteraceae bacterium]